MTLFHVNLEELVKEAAQHTDPAGPQLLISTFLKMSDPFKLDEQNERVELHEAHQTDLGAIYRYASFGRPLSTEDKEVWVDRIAWLLASMKKAESENLNKAELLAMLRTAAAFQRHGSLWCTIPADFFSTNLTDCMFAIVASTQLSINAVGPHVPIWEREAVANFQKAEAEKNWPVIENSWRTIVSAIRPNDDLSEAVRYLSAAEQGHVALAKALDKTKSTLTVAMAGGAIPANKISEVALHSGSGRTRFALIQTLASNSRQTEELKAEALGDLAEMFRSIQSDQSEWAKWMQALNRYPVRTKKLQPAIGASMVNSSYSTKSAYVDAIKLCTSYGDGRDAVGKCLEVFRSKAKRDERVSMWALCYQRWNRWEFGRGEGARPLTCLALSELDYGVIGYFAECLSDEEFLYELNIAHGALSKCQDEWHRDHIAFNDAWFRSLSRWQVITYANSVRENKLTWELPKQVYLPFDPAKEHYFAMTLDTHLPYGFTPRPANFATER